jgi:hypothetical protein
VGELCKEVDCQPVASTTASARMHMGSAPTHTCADALKGATRK